MTVTEQSDVVTVRQVDLTDRLAFTEVVEVCRRALGWRDGDPNEAFFRWKHLENPFGVSPA